MTRTKTNQQAPAPLADSKSEQAAAPPPTDALAEWRAQAVSGEYSAGLLRKAFFSWTSPLFRAGNSHQLRESDLLAVAGDDLPATVAAGFERRLQAALGDGRPRPVRRALVAQFWRPMLVGAAFKFANSTLNFVAPLLLYYLLEAITDAASGAPTLPAFQSYVLAVFLFVAIATRTITENAYFHAVVKVGFRVRTALTMSIYRKALRLSPAAKGDAPTGQITNLMQLDSQRLDMLQMQVRGAGRTGDRGCMDGVMRSRFCNSRLAPRPSPPFRAPAAAQRPLG
jgi:hypothetical protein